MHCIDGCMGKCRGSWDHLVIADEHFWSNVTGKDRFSDRKNSCKGGLPGVRKGTSASPLHHDKVFTVRLTQPGPHEPSPETEVMKWIHFKAFPFYCIKRTMGLWGLSETRWKGSNCCLLFLKPLYFVAEAWEDILIQGCCGTSQKLGPR